MIRVETHWIETKYYIATQDGRLDNQEFDTYEQAQTELQGMSFSGRGCYIQSYDRRLNKLPEV